MTKQAGRCHCLGGRSLFNSSVLCLNIQGSDFAFRIYFAPVAIDTLRAKPLLQECRDVDLPILKLAMLTCRYYGRACGFPGDATARLSQLFAQLQSEIVHSEQPPIVDTGTTKDLPF